MAVDWDAELLAPVMGFFGEGQTTDLSSLPLYSPQGGSAFHLPDAVFDRAYADVTLDEEGSPITTLRPCLGVRMKHFTDRMIEPKQNDGVFIPSVGLSFVVVDPRFDGHGHARLMMMAAA